MKAKNLFSLFKEWLFPLEETTFETKKDGDAENQDDRPVIKDEKWFRESIEQKGVLYVFERLEKTDRKIPVNLITDELFKLTTETKYLDWYLITQFFRLLFLLAPRIPSYQLNQIVNNCYNSLNNSRFRRSNEIIKNIGLLLSEELQEKLVLYILSHNYHHLPNYWKHYTKYFPQSMISELINESQTKDVLLFPIKRMLSEDLFKEDYIKRIINSYDLAAPISKEIGVYFMEIQQEIRDKLITRLLNYPPALSNIARILRNHFHKIPEDLRQEILEKIIRFELTKSSLIGLLEDFFEEIPESQREKILLLILKEPKFKKAVKRFIDKHQNRLSNESLMQLQS